MGDLSTVKVGDKIVIEDRTYGPSLATVAKVGKVHLTTDRGTKYSIKTGVIAGGRRSWNPSRATLLTPAIQRVIDIKTARCYIARNWSNLTPDEALMLAATMKTALEDFRKGAAPCSTD